MDIITITLIILFCPFGYELIGSTILLVIFGCFNEETIAKHCEIIYVLICVLLPFHIFFNIQNFKEEVVYKMKRFCEFKKRYEKYSKEIRKNG